MTKRKTIISVASVLILLAVAVWLFWDKDRTERARSGWTGFADQHDEEDDPGSSGPSVDDVDAEEPDVIDDGGALAGVSP